MRFLTSLTTLVALAQYAIADVSIKVTGSPVAGSPLTITFTDAGGTYGISNLLTGTVNLYVGGNTNADSAVIQANIGTITYPSTTLTSVAINGGEAAAITNGFYLGVVSAAKDGSTIVNFSPRFSISGMTGTTSAAFIQAAANANGVVPTAQTTTAAAANADGGAVQTGMFATPYQDQVGLTKYAPMQSVPPTRISKKKTGPLFPTSAYTVATTFLGKPTILTTITEGQTVSYSSVENTAAPQSHPQQAAMKRFLERWKD